MIKKIIQGILIVTLNAVFILYAYAQDIQTIVRFPIAPVESVPSETNLEVEAVDKTADVWEKILSSAQNEICMGMFYMISRDGSRLEKIINIIEKKAAEGVSVKVVTDSAFYVNYPEVPDRLAGLENCEVRIIDLRDKTGGVMHAKYFIVDGFHFYVGSANFDWRSLEHIREIGLAGTSKEISDDLLAIFNVDFNIASGDTTLILPGFHSSLPDYEKLKTASIDTEILTLKIVATPRSLTPENILPTEDAVLKIINTANEEILVDIFQYGLKSAYSPAYYDELDRALRRAAARGVKVKLMVSDWGLNEIQQAHLKSLQIIPNIEVRYIEIPQASEGFIPFARVSHTKLLIADRRAAWTGSANWQPGYFDGSRNVGIITGNKWIAYDLSRFFMKAWDSPYARYLEINKTYEPPRRTLD